MASYILNIACSPYNSFEKRNVRVQIKCTKDVPESSIDPNVFAYRNIDGEYRFDHVCSTVDMVEYDIMGSGEPGESFKWCRSDTVDILVRTLSIAQDFIYNVKSDVKMLYMNMCAHNNVVGTEEAIIGNTCTLELDRFAPETSIDRIPFGYTCSLGTPLNGGILTEHDGHIWFTLKPYIPGEEVYANDSFSYALTNPDGVIFNYTYIISIKPYTSKGFVQHVDTTVGVPVAIDYTDITTLNTWLDPDTSIWELTTYPLSTRQGIVFKESDTVLRYTPNSDYVGDDDFDYKVTDGKRDAVIHCTVIING